MSDFLYVTDASVFVDVYRVGFRRGFYQLGDIRTSDLVFAECLKVAPEYKAAFEADRDASLLTVESLDPAQLTESGRLYNVEPALSPQDCSVLILSKDLPVILLTSDAALKRAAKARGLRAHGLLYCLQIAVDEGYITRAAACTCLLDWALTNEFAPVRLIERYLARWGEGQ